MIAVAPEIDVIQIVRIPECNDSTNRLEIRLPS